MKNLFKNLGKEKRKIRWSTPLGATKLFFASLFMVLVFVLIIWLFSLGITSLESLAN